MSALELFQAGAWSVRAEVRDGEPWFVARDVCEALGITNSRDAVVSLDDDEKGVGSADTLGGAQQVVMISEAGLYSLVLRSRRPEAKAFKRWVTHDVLPAIRRTGRYEHPAAQPTFEIPQTYADALQVAADLAREKAALEAVNAVLAPKAALAEAVIDAAGDMSLRDAAQTLARDHGIAIGQNRLMAHLRRLGWVDRHGHPYQARIERGLLAVRVRTYDHPHTGEATISTQVRVTPKGLAELHRLLTPQPALTLVSGGAS